MLQKLIINTVVYNPAGFLVGWKRNNEPKVATKAVTDLQLLLFMVVATSN